jgi:hypothetical protein
MIIKPTNYREIEFVNQCKCLYSAKDLERAINWYSDKPVARLKRVFMHGRYPAISIYDEKIHVHRLLAMYYEERDLDSAEYVHHIDGDVLNARRDNLVIQSASEHQRNANLGHKQSPQHIAKRIDATTRTRYGHPIYENPELLKEV